MHIVKSDVHFPQAIEVLHVKRIGHGYKVLDCPEIYAKCLAKDQSPVAVEHEKEKMCC